MKRLILIFCGLLFSFSAQAQSVDDLCNKKSLAIKERSAYYREQQKKDQKSLDLILTKTRELSKKFKTAELETQKLDGLLEKFGTAKGNLGVNYESLSGQLVEAQINSCSDQAELKRNIKWSQGLIVAMSEDVVAIRNLYAEQLRPELLRLIQQYRVNKSQTKKDDQSNKKNE